MATPWRHPKTGSYYIRRQIPEALRPCFGDKSIWQVSLKTKDLEKAKPLFAAANAELEQRFADARAALGQSLDPDRAVEIVGKWLHEPLGRGVRGELVLYELEQMAHVELAMPAPALGRRVNPDEELDGALETPEGYQRPGDLWNDLFRQGRSRWRPLVEAYVTDIRAASELLPGAGPIPNLDEPIADALGKLVSGFGRNPGARSSSGRLRKARARLRPQMRLMELFELWKAECKPRPQTEHEFKGAIRDLIDFIGDIPVREILRSDLLDYRDEASCLPASMPRADRALPFPARVDKHRDAEPKISPATLKKRIGAVQALLAFASRKEWIPRNEGRDIDITDYKKGRKNRRSLEDHELKQLFESDLFVSPNDWSRAGISSTTLYWLFLLGLTSGARPEEIGQCTLDDVKQAGKIVYLDIDEYTPTETLDTHDKSVKTDESRRLVPIHRHLIDLGFADYVRELRLSGAVRLFPDLKPSTFDKLTKETSRQANKYMDRIGLKDRRLVFYSLRHTFKDLARDAHLQDSIIDQICGHAPTTTGGRYGRGARLSTVYGQLNRIRFQCIDWSLLRAAASARASGGVPA